jgi:hypothetical protein
LNKIFKFENLIGLSALFVAGCAAFYSIVGISTLFSGSFIAAMLMSMSLELGKLVSTSFIFRYWQKTKLYLKLYLIFAIIVLSMITSMGIFGYLSGAYQTSSIENAMTEQKITTIEGQKIYTQNKISDARKKLQQISELRLQQEARLNESVTNKLISRNPIQMAQLQQQTQDLIDQSVKDGDNQNDIIQKSINELQSFDSKIYDLKVKNSEKKDILTFKFVADAIHLDLNTTVKWFIALLITVFDPLALCLLLAYNTAIFYKNEETTPPKEDVVTPSISELPVSEIAVENTVKESIPAVENSPLPIPAPIPPKKSKSRGFWSY